MAKLKCYANYGVLRHEKRIVFTASNPEESAVTYDEMEVTLPDGWELNETVSGGVVLTSPWGWDYLPNEVLSGDEHPYFIAIDKDNNKHQIKLDYKIL